MTEIEARAAIIKFFDYDLYKYKMWFKVSNPLLGGLSPDAMIEFGQQDRLWSIIETSLDENERID